MSLLSLFSGFTDCGPLGESLCSKLVSWLLTQFFHLCLCSRLYLPVTSWHLMFLLVYVLPFFKVSHKPYYYFLFFLPFLPLPAPPPSFYCLGGVLRVTVKLLTQGCNFSSPRDSSLQNILPQNLIPFLPSSTRKSKPSPPASSLTTSPLFCFGGRGERGHSICQIWCFCVIRGSGVGPCISEVCMPGELSLYLKTPFPSHIVHYLVTTPTLTCPATSLVLGTLH